MKTGVAFGEQISRETEHCFVMKIIFAWSLQKKKKKTTQEKILYPLPQLVSPELLKNWRPSLPY